LITPPFQAPDEPAHFAYVKQVAETGSLPTSGGEFSVEEKRVLQALHQKLVRQNTSVRTISSQAEQSSLDEALKLGGQDSERGSSGAGLAASEPPLYYALESIPYTLGSGGTLLDRLELMRLLSALMAGLTALFTFLFLRETLPRLRWAWTVGALGVAFSPLFGFMSGAVNPDAMLFAVCAALFFGLARAFRYGLTPILAGAIGSVIAVGFVTKLNFIGVMPGVALGLLVLVIRAARTSKPAAFRSLAIAGAIGCTPVVVYMTVNLLSGHPILGIVPEAVRTTQGSVLNDANYIWQFYFPRLPGTVNDFPGLFTTRQIWFDGYIGRFGWFDTFFPGWVYTIALIAAALLAVLCIRALLVCRVALRHRLVELAVYSLIALGVMALVGADSFREFPAHEASYGQARYLLPMLPLLGALLALAARGAGRRWGPVVGALIVVLFFAHDLFSQLQVIARYYG
jgi:4-amino-4-deoxy-L-arabinose transferase-like glycosyltransferase